MLVRRPHSTTYLYFHPMFVMSLRYFSSSLAFVHVTPTEYNGAHLPPWADFPCSISPHLKCGIVSVPKGLTFWKHLAEIFPETYRSVLAPSWLSSTRAWKNTPGACVSYTPQYADTVLILLIANVPLGAMILRA